MTEQRAFRVEQAIEAPAEEVWNALTRLDQVSEWFGWDHPGIGDEIRFIFADHAEHAPPDSITWDNGQAITLVPDDRRTVVRVTMAGPAGDADWEGFYDGLREGWRTFFAQLRFWLERKPAGRRRTLFLTGTATASAALAAASAGGVREVWHESVYQRVVVDGGGHLIALEAQRPLSDDAAGPIGVTVAAYGLPDAAFAELRERWESRWSAAARDAEVTL
ncbi:Uncharacterized conserved protein YndB, AHSA1/START domain [Sinosporangium album]|uniref:Uncharacterized conserved protein YndB, AHSA1/START domain n=1 Tax=Sinosporangium album TaxID=504805 RepID=A0A1G7R7S9_9ACTN|nr:SRPBCC domain-containing protein [Sinosporangium album]SDG06777.1 Uncharacterized conserved protein YndB, AHSA1/START domain [Sinosporangium album]